MRVQPVHSHQLIMVTLLDKLAIFQNHNLISIFNRRKTMRNNKGRSAYHQAVQSLLYHALAFRIECRGCLVENQNLRVLQYCPGNRNALTLTTGNIHTAVTQHCFIAVRQLHNKVMGIRSLRCSLYLFTCRIKTSVKNVIINRTVEQHCFLRYNTTYGNLVQLLVTMKGLPLAYNKDLQEDKEGALDTAHTLMQCLSVIAGMISTWTVNEDAMARECGVGHLAATDVADYLAKRGLPFREAHAVVGHLVLMCEKRGCNLEDLPFEVFKEASPLFERDITEALDIPSTVAARMTEGGTAPAAVAVQLDRAEAQLVADEGVFGSLTKVVEMGHGAK